jgi:hypothetical protein
VKVKKKLLILITCLVILAVVIFHHDPLQMVANFIIGGIVPGLDISLGFLPSLAVIIALLLLMKRWVRELHFQMVRRAALDMNAERARLELEDTDTKDQVKNRRAVIAARSLKGGATQL